MKDAIFYQIFPDRFAMGSRYKSVELDFKQWGTDPAEQGFHGGDLWGVIDKLDYLKKFGINALYLNPIFSSASNHRYHTYDYYQVDPLLGGNKALKKLLKEAHKRKIKVVLDGVFNHASRGFWAFHHILENGPESPYVDWFHIKNWPLNPYPKHEEEALNYIGWWNLPALPKFNTENLAVREYLMRVAEYWIEFGIDGWRLDVPHEIDDDSFWQEFRLRVKKANPDAYICGEIWDIGSRWLKGDMFDATMNYPLTGAVLGWFGYSDLDVTLDKDALHLSENSSEQFAERINTITESLSPEILQSQFNLLDSHDMARALTILGENTQALKQALLFLFCFPGAPCIYYGTEIGMKGTDDPYCRESFPWQNDDCYPNDLRPWISQLVSLRQKHSIFTNGVPKIIAINEHIVLLELENSQQNTEAFLLLNRSGISYKMDELDVDFSGYRCLFREQVKKDQNIILARESLVFVEM